MDERGKAVGQKVCQFEPREGGDGKLTASGTLYWLMDGATKPGSERRFEVRLEAAAGPRAAASGVVIQKDAGQVKVGNPWYELTFDLRAGGVVKEVLFRKSGRRVALQAGDSLAGESKTGRERPVWRLASDAKPEVRVVLEGPLASVIEVRARFPLSKKRAEDCPLAIYRYTFFAGSPLVKVNVRLPAHDLQTVVEAMAFLQFMASADHPFKRWPSGEPLTTGDLAGAGKHITLSGGGVFKRWGALVNDEDAMGMIGGQLGGMYDGKNGPYLTGYSRAPWRGGPWRGEEVEWTGYLYLGESGRTGEAVGRYAAGLAGYAIRMRIPTLEARIEHEARNAEALVGQLYHGLLWPRQGRENAARVLASTSRMLLSAAAERMEQGREIAALGVLADWADALTAEAGQVFGGKGKVPALPWFGRRGEFVAVANERLALLFHDARLQSVFHSGHAYPLLRFSARPRPLWRLMVKEKASGRLSELSSVGKAVTFGSERSADGGLRLKWEWRDVAVGDDKLRVRVTAALAASDPLTRWRIEVENPSQRFGLWEVDFPVVAGIGKKRTSPESDFLALPFKSGMLVPDPGQGAEYSQGYPGEAAMQFLPYWHGRSGLFMAAYDPAANLKEIKVASADDETVEYRLSHLVPDCDAPGKGFALPYDAILGVFDGDWYDAAKLYRRWALQQPWCPKKPLAANEDIPKW
ncbi:MAG: hypothetical protein FJ272_15300, partial [Planctomycetes bacterium]|nr:hypothetical protein [Planctomycetota bacterium]